MKASEYTKIVNGLEDCQRLLINNGQAADPNIDQLIRHYLLLRAPLISELNNTAQHAREKMITWSTASRLQLFKNWRPSDSEVEQYRAAISSLIDWEFPCLEIFPGDGACTPCLLGAEPLYIADWHQELLDHAGAQFNEFYNQRRLLKYVIKDFDLSALPQNSFGLVTCVNWLRFEDIHGLNKLAQSVYDCLLSGGRFLFTYVSSNHWQGVVHMENNWASGIDTQELHVILKQVGFEIHSDRQENSILNLVLVKKPGNIKPIKASSVLGKYIDRPEDIK